MMSLLSGSAARFANTWAEGSSNYPSSAGRTENRAKGLLFMLSKAQVIASQKKWIKNPVDEGTVVMLGIRSISTEPQDAQLVLSVNAAMDSFNCSDGHSGLVDGYLHDRWNRECVRAIRRATPGTHD